jgi:hypothetical protein
MRNRDEIDKRDKSLREIQNDRVWRTVPYKFTHSALSQSFSQFCQKEERLFFRTQQIIWRKVWIKMMYLVLMWAAIAQSVQRLATGWTVRGSNPGVGEISRTRPDRPWGPASLLYNGFRVSFPGVMWPERGVDHPPHLAPRLKKE